MYEAINNIDQVVRHFSEAEAGMSAVSDRVLCDMGVKRAGVAEYSVRSVSREGVTFLVAQQIYEDALLQRYPSKVLEGFVAGLRDNSDQGIGAHQVHDLREQGVEGLLLVARSRRDYTLHGNPLMALVTLARKDFYEQTGKLHLPRRAVA